jgi:hypothetical protein
MNSYRRTFHQILIFAALFFMVACEKDANEIEYGNPLIYMPQAAIFSGGLNNNYPVPGPNTVQNYRIDSINNKVDIYLGVYRAGLQALEAYSVEVYANNDTLNSLIADSVFANAAPLPESVCSFPSTVSVVDGEREKTFYLTIDKAKLNSEYAELKGKTLVYVVGIKNPTNYELNPNLSSTVILINSVNFIE